MTTSSERPFGISEVTSVDEMLPGWTIRQSDFQPDRPIGALRLEVAFPAKCETSSIVPALVELLRSLNDQEIELGGQGLVLDQPGSRVVGGQILLLLRPLDVLGSLTRCEQLAKTLADAEVGQTPAFPSPGETSDEPCPELLDEIASECSKSRGARVSEKPANIAIAVRAIAVAAV